MKKEIKKFLEFNGKKIHFVAADGQWWIAIKPICEALSVDFEAQRKNLKEDKTLGQLPSEQTVVAADNRQRKMACLPEFFIYGWIFQLQSQSEDLQKYKFECYKVLYEHFHGAIAGRKELITQKAKAQLAITKLEKRLAENEDHKKLLELKTKEKSFTTALKNQDKDMLLEEKDLWHDSFFSNDEMKGDPTNE